MEYKQTCCSEPRERCELLSECSFQNLTSSGPSSLGKEILRKVNQVVRIDRAAGESLRSGFVGPVDDYRFADDVFSGNKTPVAAVFGVIAIVAESEVVALGNDEFAVDGMVAEHGLAGRKLGVFGAGWEVIPEGRGK